jgi:hypothetical protein
VLYWLMPEPSGDASLKGQAAAAALAGSASIA